MKKYLQKRRSKNHKKPKEFETITKEKKGGWPDISSVTVNEKEEGRQVSQEAPVAEKMITTNVMDKEDEDMCKKIEAGYQNLVSLVT